MAKCKKCDSDIPHRVDIFGKFYYLRTTRTKCLSCSPFIPNIRRKRNRIIRDDSTGLICKCGNIKKSHLSVCRSCIVNDRRFQVREKAIDYLGSKCSRCSYHKCLKALEFHHKNPKEKDFQISGNHTRKWESIQSELDKCVLLCANCHVETHDEIAKRESQIKSLGPMQGPLLVGENRCGCGRIYEINRKKGNSRTKCNSCRSKVQKLNFKQYICSIKGSSCQVCGYSNSYRALVFHHKDPSIKDFNLNTTNGRKALDKVLAELDKCILLCQNCHREEHVRLGDVVSEESLKLRPNVQKKTKNYRNKETRPRKTLNKNSTVKEATKRKQKFNPIKKDRPTKRPPKEVLESLLWEIPSTKIGERFNVSDKAIEKWAKFYGLEKPPRGYWARTRSERPPT